MRLTDQEIAEIKTLIDSGEALPEKYRFALFKEPHETELIWPGKTHEVTNVVLPFQSIEQIDEPRAETAASGADLFTLDRATGRQSGGWTNKLIWGDNKLVLSSLKNGPLRREIEKAGGLKLVYIDPPFDVGGDFSFNVEVGNDVVTKEPSVVEEIAYRDTWGRGRDSYFGMISERLKLIHDLIAADGTIYVHCDWRVNAGIRAILDEIFTEYGFRNEIVWFYENKLGTGWQAKTFDTRHDIIFRFSKSQTFVHNPIVEAVKNQKMQPVTQKLKANVFGSKMRTGR
jgi:hypothetical protein